MSKEKQIEEMYCKKCLHYEMCLENFREAKKKGFWELTDEEKYFSHADECDFYVAGYRKQSENIIELPCRVGDMVYCIEHKTIRECLVTMVKSLTFANETKFFVEAECEIESPFYSDGRKIKHGLSAVWEIEWGSWYRAFRTRGEAENALAKMKGGAE